MTKNTTKKLITTIRHHKFITEKELETMLKYKTNAMHTRLNRLVIQGAINFTKKDGIRKYYIDDVKITIKEPIHEIEILDNEVERGLTFQIKQKPRGKET